MPLGLLFSQYQTLLALEPVDPLVVHRPALRLEEDMEAPLAVANRGLGKIPDLRPQRSLLICYASLPVAGPGQGRHLADPELANAVGRL